MLFSARNQTRIWFHPPDTVRFPLQLNEPNHTQDVLHNPDVFGIDLAQLSEPNRTSKQDYVGEILYAAEQNDWVRIFLDFRDLRRGKSNIEGTQWGAIHKAAIWLDKFSPGMHAYAVVVRRGPGDNQGDTYWLTSRREVEFFKEWGKLLREIPDVVGESEGIRIVKSF